MNTLPNHPCPCCGYRTYVLPAGGTMQLCPVCFWEDAPVEAPYNGSNQVNLLEAQRNFAGFGASERSYRNAVRSPLPEENRSPHWLSMDDLRERLISMIEEAFADVTLDGGVTLHQMEVIDDYGGEAEQLAARRKDPETRWQDISSEKLSSFYMSMVFLDAKGVRFHLPAFMRHALTTTTEFDGVMFALAAGPKGSYCKDGLDLLTPAQMQCAAAFLHYFGNLPGFCADREARLALKSGWDQWTPDFVRQALL